MPKVVSRWWFGAGVATLLCACSGSDSQSLPTTGRDAESEVDSGQEGEDGGLPDAAAPDADQSDAAPVAEGCTIDPNAVVVEHSDTITADQTWAAGPHLIKFHTSVRMGATLTIAPCAVVRVRIGQGIDIWQGGTIVAEGSANQPIRFEPELPGNTWSVFQVNPGANLRLAHATIHGAGTTNDTGAGALSLRGAFELPVVRVQHVTIEAAPRFGVRLDQGALFTADSEDLTITGAGEFPVITHPGSAGSLPLGHYTGNSHDEILITDGSVQRDMTLRDLSVPYHVGRIGSRNTSLRVAASLGAGAPPGVPLLIIEAGVTLRFEPAAVMEIEHATSTAPASGALRVLGSIERPVLFTSAATPAAAGDWLGIWFGSVPDPRNVIDHARVEYAGGVAGAQNFSCDNPAAPVGQQNRNQAAVVILGLPSAGFVTNTTIAHSAADGISRGYFGAPIDFLASNSFEDVAWCQQSYPRPPTGPCPVPVPCPR